MRFLDSFDIDIAERSAAFPARRAGKVGVVRTERQELGPGGSQHGGQHGPGSQHNGNQHSGNQHSGSQHNGSQHNGSQHNGSQHNGSQHSGNQHNGNQHSGSCDSGPERGRERRPTLASIAAEAGFSLPTVSKVVNGRSDVAPPTRALIERLLDQHNYPRQRSGDRAGTRPGSRRAYRSGLIDLVFSGLESPWAVEILRGVEEFCSAHRIGAAVSAVRHGNARPASWTSTLASHDSDGVILVTSELTDDQVHRLRADQIPLVVVDPANMPDPDVPSVGATNWAGGLAATEHLLAHGHQRIAALSGPSGFLCSRARIDGYRFALERAGLAYQDDWVRDGNFLNDGGFVLGGELLDLDPRPTAIFAGNDEQALGVYEAARQRGLRIPQDLSVIGFDDLPVARWVSPPLTTVRQPLAEMGRAAAKMILRLVEGAPLRSRRVELSTELVERESCAAPPAPGAPAAGKAGTAPAGANQPSVR